MPFEPCPRAAPHKPRPTAVGRWASGGAARSRAGSWLLALLLSAGVVACGGGDLGNARDSGPDKTTLSVAASDEDGQALTYQWRVTSGTVDNRNAAQTTWTLPPGPGLHFAYVLVGDGQGGYSEHRYAVSTDTLDNPAPARVQALHTPPPVTDVEGPAFRLRAAFAQRLEFTPAEGGARAERRVYLPDLVVQLTHVTSGERVFAGTTNERGEVALPRLRANENYVVHCGRSAEAPLAECGRFAAPEAATAVPLTPTLPDTRNLRLYGHVALADGAVCGHQSEFFDRASSATVQLQASDGAALSPVLRVNRFGDYALDAAVPAQAALKLRVVCEGYSRTLDVPAAGAAGYVAATPVELSHVVPNRVPRITKVVANGPDGSVRGRSPLVALPGAASEGVPGASHFLSYKGLDTALSACMYYRSIGMVAGCDAQGRFDRPVTMEDWKRRHQLAPYGAGNEQVGATYINAMDLNLVRQMVATQSAPDTIAFLVCNNPGPEGRSQAEVDDVIDRGVSGELRVACVGMESSPTPGVNGGRPFTKFVTFGPDGALLPSVNLDGRGEKYLPGTCVACHGGGSHSGRFPERGNPSPYLGSRFLPFDTGNFAFSSRPELGEAAQGEAIYKLNRLVRATEPLTTTPSTATTRLIDGWYAHSRTLDRDYVPEAWLRAEPTRPGAARFYREVIGLSCRTCHTGLGTRFDWDAQVLSPTPVVRAHICGGTAELAVNATMPNALVTRDRVAEKTRADPTLAELKRAFLGCDEPLPDPAFTVR